MENLLLIGQFFHLFLANDESFATKSRQRADCHIPDIIKKINLFTRSLQVVRVLIMANF